MADPRKLLETSLFSLLNTALTPAVYNTQAAQGAAFGYVVFQAAGGDDEGYHAKKRWYVYHYQVLGIHTDRAAAEDMAVAVDTAMKTAKAGLSVTGHAIVRVTRSQPIDYSQAPDDNVLIHYVGGIYEIELQES